MTTKKIILTGATGFSGQEVLKQLLADATVTEVILLVRKSAGMKNPKLIEFVLNDLLDYTKIYWICFQMLLALMWQY